MSDSAFTDIIGERMQKVYNPKRSFMRFDDLPDDYSVWIRISPKEYQTLCKLLPVFEPTSVQLPTGDYVTSVNDEILFAVLHTAITENHTRTLGEILIEGFMPKAGETIQ